MPASLTCEYRPDGNGFNGDVDYWSTANLNAGCDCKCSTPNWMDRNTCHPECFPDTFPYTSDRFVYFVKFDPNGEGIRNDLFNNGSPYNLMPNRTYILRMRLRPNSSNNHIRVHFAKWGQHWNSNSSNNQKWSDAATHIMNIPEFDRCRWYQVEKQFTVPSNLDELHNIIFIMEEGGFSIDDVELFLSPTAADCCPDFKLYEATQNLPTTIHVEDFIRAGNDAGIPGVSGDVIVQSGQNVTFKAGNFIELLPGFETELGAIFTAEIEDCNNVTNPNGGPITILQFPGSFGGVNDKNQLFVYVNGATEYSVEVRHRDGGPVFKGNGLITSNPFPVWDGHCNQPLCTNPCVSADEYFVILELTNCDNSASDNRTVTVFSGMSCKAKNNQNTSNTITDTLSTPEPLTLTDTSSAQTLQPGFNIYPNPYQGSTSLPVKSDKLFVDITGNKDAQVLIVVVDMLGIEHYSKVFVLKEDNYTLAIDPEGKLAPGVYMVIAASDNEIYRKKIVIQ